MTAVVPLMRMCSSQQKSVVIIESSLSLHIPLKALDVYCIHVSVIVILAQNASAGEDLKFKWIF